jgi:hypothetical protein
VQLSPTPFTREQPTDFSLKKESKMAPDKKFEWEKVPRDGEQAIVEEPTSDHDEGSGLSDDMEHKATGALSWGFESLKRILKAAKGAATSQVLEFIKEQYVVNAVRYV